MPLLYSALHQVNILIFFFSRNSFCCQCSIKTVLQDSNLDFSLVQKKTTHYLIRKFKTQFCMPEKDHFQTSGPISSKVKSKVH